MSILLLKLLITPTLIFTTTLAARKWGHAVGGWLIALPLTSGPVAYFLMIEQGQRFASIASLSMLAGTISQICFAVTYRFLAQKGITASLLGGTLAFIAMTLLLKSLDLNLVLTAAAVAIVMALAWVWIKSTQLSVDTPRNNQSSKWDLPFRMFVATGVVLVITTFANQLGAHLSGLISPYPVYAAVTAAFTHKYSGKNAAIKSLDGLVFGLASAATFFITIHLTIIPFGKIAFILATLVSVATQALSVKQLRN